MPDKQHQRQEDVVSNHQPVRISFRHFFFIKMAVDEVLRLSARGTIIERKHLIFRGVVDIDPTLRPQHLNRCAHVFSLARSELRA